MFHPRWRNSAYQLRVVAATDRRDWVDMQLGRGHKLFEAPLHAIPPGGAGGKSLLTRTLITPTSQISMSASRHVPFALINPDAPGSRP